MYTFYTNLTIEKCIDKIYGMIGENESSKLVDFITGSDGLIGKVNAKKQYIPFTKDESIF